jgi:hypothetical protein
MALIRLLRRWLLIYTPPVCTGDTFRRSWSNAPSARRLAACVEVWATGRIARAVTGTRLSDDRSSREAHWELFELDSNVRG